MVPATYAADGKRATPRSVADVRHRQRSGRTPYRRIFAVDARLSRHGTCEQMPPDLRGGIAELTLLSRHEMSAAGLLAAGGSGDDLREHGSHDARGAGRRGP